MILLLLSESKFNIVFKRFQLMQVLHAQIKMEQKEWEDVLIVIIILLIPIIVNL